MTLPVRELLKLASGYGRKAKFRNIPTEVDGIKFDSRAEARRYGELKLLERAGEIHGLTLQPKFPLTVGATHVCDYVGDFMFSDKAGVSIVEDVKSKATKTPVYRLKKKLLRALYGIEIREVE